MSGRPIRVLVVDDSLLIREALTSMLNEAADMEVVGAASDPYEARTLIKELHPDVLTLDIEMPKMDGISFLEKIMSLRPMPVVMLSSLTQKGADMTIRALELGAVDAVGKPSGSHGVQGLYELKDMLIEKIRIASRANLRLASRRSQHKDPSKSVEYKGSYNSSCLIAIGSSTGGVEALRDLLLDFPVNTPPVVIAQHMPENFTRSFATRLNGLVKMEVSEAQHHVRLQAGHAYIAPGGRHLKIVRLSDHYVCKLEDGSTVSGHKPSVDVLFHSVAEAAGNQALGIILTGMGRDGAKGLKAMRDQGAYTIGQNKDTCVVYGMPQAAFQEGAVTEELPLQHIASQALQQCASMGKKS